MLNAAQIKHLRLLHKITQNQIASEIKTTKVFISNIENGKAPYSQEMHDKIINAIYKIVQEHKK